MPRQVARQEANWLKVRRLGCRLSKAPPEMDIALHAWSRLPPTIWKKPSCAASAANLNRHAWPAGEKRSRFNKSFAERKKWAATIHAPAALARNSRSATGRKPPQIV